MWILICPLLLIALAVILLFVPIRITINTFQGEASVRWGILSACITARTGEFRYRLSVPFYHWEGRLEELLSTRRTAVRRPRKEEKEKEKKRKSLERGGPSRLHLFERIVRSFRVKRFRWYLDTGDPIWNAWLFPLFHLWRLRGQDVRVAFNGKSGLVLVLNNNCYRLLKAVFFNQQPKNPRS